MTPTINPTFHNLIPPLSPDELAGLEAALRADGCRDPLVTWKGTLVDGHNRLEICQRHKLPFKTVAVEFADEDAAQVWIIRNQFGRRNLSAFTRAELALKLEPLLKAKAKAKQREAGGAVPQKSAEAPIETRQELARAAGVSHDTIAKVKVIESKASEETKAALRSGETSINAEYKKLIVHVAHNSGENEWYTPPEFLESARKAMGSITCDPASSDLANETVKADIFFTAKDDGLTQKWSGSVWLNPPYAQPLVAQFAEAVCAKLESGEIKRAIVLVNNATETAWFQRMLLAASAVCFVKGRVKFLDPSGAASGAPLQGQAVLCLGGDRYRFRKAFCEFGPVLFHEPI